MDYVYAIVGFVVLTVIFTLIGLKQRNSSWQGTVTKLRTYSVDRNKSNDGPADYENYITLYYKTDSGRKGKFDFPQRGFDEIYPGLKVGDRLVKNKGEYYPKIVS